MVSPSNHEPRGTNFNLSVAPHGGMKTQEELKAQDLDSSVAEFSLSRAEGLLRNDMGCLQIFT